MKDVKAQSDKELREALKRREEELVNVSSGHFGPRQRDLYKRLMENSDAIRRELELRKQEEKGKR